MPRLDEREADGLGEAGGERHLTHAGVPRNARIRWRRRLLHARERRREMLEAVMASDLFDEIDVTVHVDAPGGRPHRPSALTRLRLEAEGLEDAADLGVGDAHAEQPLDARLSEPDRRGCVRTGIGVDERAGERARANLLQQLAGARHGQRRRRDVRAPLESHGRFGAETERAAGRPHRLRLEPSRLEHDSRRRNADLGVRAAHDAANGTGLRGVGDDQHVRAQRTGLAVERRQRLAGTRRPDDDRRPFEPRDIEGVHGMAELKEHVVGDVHHVADGAHTAGGEAFGHPRRRGPYGHVGDCAHVARAQLGRLDGDRQRRAGCPARRRHQRRQPRRGLAEGHPVGHRYLARDARHRQAIRTIGGHVEVQQRVGTVRLQAFERQSPHRELAADRFRRFVEVDELTNPGEQGFHRPNCSRKRRSFS